MVADFYEVDERTIERYIEQYATELSANGYVLCKGKRLKDLKLQFGHVINVGSKTTSTVSSVYTLLRRTISSKNYVSSVRPSKFSNPLICETNSKKKARI